jgi:hypothetical protein
MLRDEAEREAARRNLEDSGRARYEFYAFDESAGLAADAWDVSRRLREGPPPTAEWPGPGPQTPAAGAPAPPPESVVSIPPPSAPTLAPVPEDEAVFPEPLPYEDFEEDDGRPGVFVRGFGLLVMLVGVLWIAMVVALALVLKANNFTSYAVFGAAGVLGLLAVGLGIAIYRS